MGESNHSMKLFGAVISTDDNGDNGDSTVLQSRNKRRRGSEDEDEEKGKSEVEEISEKTEHVEMGESIELFDVVINTENTGDTVVEQSRNKEGNWDEDEHKKFLIGLEKLGKGNWAGIAKKFVRTRTPTQVSTHAQKYFGRQKEEREFRRYKSSVFNINLDEESSNTSPDSVVLRSTNKGNGDEQKGIFEVEEIHKSEKTGDISSSRTKDMGEKSELFDVVISTENNGGEWSEHEHKAFLTGLEKLGKGKWTRISKEFVPIRTPTQVASHAQKYFAKIDRAAKSTSIVESNKL